MKILVTGSNGQIGWELMRALPACGEVVGVDRTRMDLTDSSAIQRTLREIKPDLIVNAAGYTAVDRAEQEPQLARAVNADAVGVLGQETQRLGAAIIHYSTDYIFDGTKTTPYTPDDAPNPLSVYGRTKLEGERALIASGAAHLILRTSWVYSLRRRNFLTAMLDLAKTNSELRIVNDQTGCPTSARSIAQATVQIIAKSMTGETGPATQCPGNFRGRGRGRGGVYHLAAAGSTTWFDFARAIFDLAAVHPLPTLVPISTAEYAARAARPAYSVLDCSKTAQCFDVRIPDWQTVLRDVMTSQKSTDAH